MKHYLRRAISGLCLLLCLLAFPAVALAHPLDMLLQITYITVAPTQLVVELDITPGVLVAPKILTQLDTNGDHQISDAEGQAYGAAVVHDLVLQVDGKPLSLAVTEVDMPPYLNIQSGYGEMRIFTAASLSAGMTDAHQIYYKNNYAPTNSAYQVNAFLDKGAAIKLGKQNRDSIQQSMTLDYVIDSAAPATVAPVTVAPPTVAPVATVVTSAPAATRAPAATPVPAATPAPASLATSLGLLTSATGQAQQLLAYLYAPTLSPWVLLLALGLAVLLGGLHALTPGHGKTLVAAYLVGSRGTVKHAIWLGGIVTFTHTASVIVIGLLALFASQFVVPNVLAPLLEILSGLLVVFMGVRLVWQRWSAFRSNKSHDHEHDHEHSHAHNHAHDHTHEHSHDHDVAQPHAYTHDHGDGHVHSHLPPAEGIKLSNLLAMGVSGGLVPCPEALGIMVIAIGLNRILLGLGLIVSFSFGLAAVLIIIGVLLVRSRALIDRFGGAGSRWSSALPLASAMIVTVLGVGITFGGLVAYLK